MAAIQASWPTGLSYNASPMSFGCVYESRNAPERGTTNTNLGSLLYEISAVGGRPLNGALLSHLLDGRQSDVVRRDLLRRGSQKWEEDQLQCAHSRIEGRIERICHAASL